jgi:hypothetical protein
MKIRRESIGIWLQYIDTLEANRRSAATEHRELIVGRAYHTWRESEKVAISDDQTGHN